VNDSYLVSPGSVGLKPHQYQLIEDVVLNHASVIHAWVFGSRALGTYKDNSDIDIVIEGDGISLSVVAGLQDRLEQSSLPFKVDLLVKHRITSNELLAHIDTYGIKLK
jgi:predicted nucleotidyltransferase